MIRVLTASTALILCAATFVPAAPIAVNNASFETTNALSNPCVGTDCAFNIDAIPGWVNTGNSGTWRPGNPANSNYFDFIPDGSLIAYSNNATISQTVAATVVQGTIYTLLVDVGNRKDSLSPGYIALMIGNTVINAAPSAIVEGGWTTFSVAYTGLAQDVGQSITIQLRTSGEQGDFDNVRLDAVGASNPVPEPATTALVGLGLVALAALRRRQ